MRAQLVWRLVVLGAAVNATTFGQGSSAASPQQVWDLSTEAKSVGVSDNYLKHGLDIRLLVEGDHAVLVGIADLSTILRSESFWRSVVHTGTTPFENVLYTVTYQLNTAVTVAVLHELLGHMPSTQSFSAKLEFLLLNTKQGAKTGLGFTYTRSVDTAKYRDGDLGTVDVLQDTDNTGLEPWLRAALAREISQQIKVLTPEDIILDKDTLIGQQVSVVGFTACTNTVQMCMLYSDVANFTKNIFYDASAASREDRARLLSCSILTACKVTITGTLVDDPLKMMSATTITWAGAAADDNVAGDASSVGAQGGISVKDYILDKKSYIGQNISVFGKAQCDSNACWLTQAGWVSEQIASFDAASLSRNDRKRLLDCDQAFSNGCDVQITGRVLENNLQASSIMWK